jgi:hypothetical protein
MYGGKYIHLYHNGSQISALMEVYPDYDWKPWKFENIPQGYWEPSENRSKYMDWLENVFDIKDSKSWYQITSGNVVLNCGHGFMAKYNNSLIEALKVHYPNQNWNASKWALNGNSQTQKRMKDTLSNELPNGIEIECNFGLAWIGQFKHRPMYFDIWIPYYNIAMEYHGTQHYMEVKFVHDDEGLNNQNLRDRAKEAKCKEMEISYIGIPFWWNWDSSIMNIVGVIFKYLILV